MIADLRFLYESLLNPQTMMTFVPEAMRDAATKLLDCKQFVKDYKLETSLADANPSTTLLFCQLELLDCSEGYSTNPPPPELVVLPPNAAISDLKAEASKAFQEVYISYKGFQVEEVLGYGAVDESTPIRFLMKSLDTVCVRGRWKGKNGLGRFRMERGLERWTVDCRCGATDDDGERMLACDVCGVWQHTRCVGIPDFDVVPARFVCSLCREGPKSGAAHCRDEGAMSADIAARGRGGGGKSLVKLCI